MIYYRISAIGRVIFLLFFLWSCDASIRPVYVEGSLISVDSLVAPAKHSGVDSVISIYRDALEEEMNEVLAYAAKTMSRGTPEGLLNNFVADLCFEIGKELYHPDDGHHIDFALFNYGGLRASIRQGPVTRANVFELMPFENEMVVLTLSPEKTLELFDYLAEASVGMPVAGLRLSIEDSAVKDVRIGGQTFDPNRNYKVLSSDYLAGGGDNMTFFLEPVNAEILGMRIRDAIILHLQRQQKAGKEIKSSLDGRIRN